MTTKEWFSLLVLVFVVLLSSVLFFAGRRKEKPPEPKEWWEDDWARVRELYPVGREFEYLGRRMIVAQYGWSGLGPCLCCEYADDHGKLREWYFHATMLPLLLKCV